MILIFFWITSVCKYELFRFSLVYMVLELDCPFVHNAVICHSTLILTAWLSLLLLTKKQ